MLPTAKIAFSYKKNYSQVFTTAKFSKDCHGLDWSTRSIENGTLKDGSNMTLRYWWWCIYCNYAMDPRFASYTLLSYLAVIASLVWNVLSLKHCWPYYMCMVPKITAVYVKFNLEMLASVYSKIIDIWWMVILPVSHVSTVQKRNWI